MNMQLGMQNKLARHAPSRASHGMPAVFSSLATGSRSAVHAASSICSSSGANARTSLRRMRALPGRRGMHIAAQLAPATYAPPKADAVILTLPGGKEVGWHAIRELRQIHTASTGSCKGSSGGFGGRVDMRVVRSCCCEHRLVRPRSETVTWKGHMRSVTYVTRRVHNGFEVSLSEARRIAG